jgi:hypothetical protein
MERPGHLALRAASQYRTRDTLTYLGIRYYLESSVGRSNAWLSAAAPSLVLRRTDTPYNKVFHFKEIGPTDTIERRELTLPAPNEALVEAFLIDECVRHGGVFGRHPNVYSYVPSRPGAVNGIFNDYIVGLKERHAAIRGICGSSHDVRLCFRDIRRFYPSIRIEGALKVWQDASRSVGLPPFLVELGNKLLTDHAKVGSGSLLTGPMFSHFIGNLVLRPMDERLSNGPAAYLRYVDDVTLIGDEHALGISRQLLREEVAKLDLALHADDSPKSLDISREEWLQGDGDYDDTSWMHLIGGLKKLLLWYPKDTDSFRRSIASEELRLPVPDYRVAIREEGYVRRALQLIGWDRYRESVRAGRFSDVIGDAKALRNLMSNELTAVLADVDRATGYRQKRLLTRCRYLAGRLIYLGDKATLSQHAKNLASRPELKFHSAVAHAVASENVGGVAALGVNAAQAASQPLRAGGVEWVEVSARLESPWERQSAAILAANGLRIRNSEDSVQEDELYAFAKSGASMSLFKSNDAYIRELSSLHGLGSHARHKEVMETALDPAQDIALDAIEQARSSLSI